jgi:hypothetical protein
MQAQSWYNHIIVLILDHLIANTEMMHVSFMELETFNCVSLFSICSMQVLTLSFQKRNGNFSVQIYLDCAMT